MQTEDCLNVVFIFYNFMGSIVGFYLSENLRYFQFSKINNFAFIRFIKRFTTLGSKEIGIINSEFVTKTQFLCKYDRSQLFRLFITCRLSIPQCLGLTALYSYSGTVTIFFLLFIQFNFQKFDSLTVFRGVAKGGGLMGFPTPGPVKYMDFGGF